VEKSLRQVLCWAPQCEGDLELLEHSQQRATEMIKGPERLFCGEPGLSSLQKIRPRGDLISVQVSEGTALGEWGSGAR